MDFWKVVYIMSSTVLFFGSIALFYFVVMIPIQYLYLQGLHEKKKKTGLSQRELYEKNVFWGRTITPSCARQPIQYPFCVCCIYDFKKLEDVKKHHNVDAFFTLFHRLRLLQLLMVRNVYIGEIH